MRLWQRANGVWHIVYPGDRRVSLKTRDEAKAKRLFHATMKGVLEGQVERLRGKVISLGAFEREYLEAREHLGKSTLRNDRSALRHLVGALGAETSLRSISVKDLELFRAGLLKGGLSPVTVNAYLRHLRSAFATAKRWSYLSKNPLEEVGSVLEPERISTPVVAEVLEAILGKASPEEVRVFRFLLLTGLRPFELCKLRYADITGGVIRVQGKRGRKREVPVLGELEGMIGEGKGVDHVIPWRHPCTLSHRFRAVATAAGYPDVRLYDLRHTFGTVLTMAGADPHAVSKLMGHTSLSTTRRYVTVTRGHLEQIMGALDGAFGAGASDRKRTPHLQAVEK